MNINYNLTDVEISDSDKQLLKDCLSIKDTEVNDAIQKIAKTSLLEYLKMFKEKGLPTRADEVQQERLYFFLLHYYIDRLPNESEISSIFQLTHSQSSTLLRNTLSRYRTKISDFINNTLKNIVKSGKAEDEKYQIIIYSKVILEELNLLISQKGPGLEQIKKIKDTSSKFSCPVDTYNLLKKELNINE